MYVCIRSTVLDMNRMESKATNATKVFFETDVRLKFHEEFSDNLFIFTTVATH